VSCILIAYLGSPRRWTLA